LAGIVIDIYDAKLIKDARLGSVYLPLSQLPANRYLRKWYPIETDSSSSRAAKSNSAELLVEAIYISVEAAVDNSSPAGELLKRRSEDTIRAQVASEPLTLNYIFEPGGPLVEFAHFMSQNNGSNILQFLLMSDSVPPPVDIYSAFLAPDSKYNLHLPPNIIHEYQEIGNLDHLRSAVMDIVEKHWIEQFKRSEGYKEWLADEIRRRGRESKKQKVNSNKNAISPNPSKSLNNHHQDHVLKSPIAEDAELTISNKHSLDTPTRDFGTTELLNSRNKVVWNYVITPLPWALQGVPATEKYIPFKDDQYFTLQLSAKRRQSVWKLHKRSRSMNDMDFEYPLRRQFDKNKDEYSAVFPSEIKLNEDDGNESRPSLTLTERSSISDDNLSRKLETAHQSGGTVFLHTAVATLREQVEVVESALERTPLTEGKKIRTLVRSRASLLNQIQQLVEMMEQQGLEGGPIDLTGVIVKVHDGNPGVDSGAGFVSSAIWRAAAVASRTDKSLVYVLECSKSDGNGGWMKTTTYSDFLTLHEELKRMFPKVTKIPFPVRARLGGVLPGAQMKKLAGELEAYLNLLLTDRVLCECKSMQDFMKPENVGAVRSKTVGEEVGDKVVGLVKGVGGVLKKLAGETTLRRKSDAHADPINHNIIAPSISSKIVGETDPSKPQMNEDTRRLKQRMEDVTSRKLSSAKIEDSKRRNSIEQYQKTHTASIVYVPQRTSSLDTKSHLEVASSKLDLKNCQTSSSPSLLSTESTKLTFPQRSQNSTSTNEDSEYMIEPTGRKSPKSEVSKTIVNKKSPLTEAEVDVILECLFGIVEEIFQLGESNQWLRQKGLHVLKNLLRVTYGSHIAELVQNRLLEATSQNRIKEGIDAVTDLLWPGGIWFTSPEANRARPRTEEDREDTKVEAKKLWLNESMNIDVVQRVVGRYTCIMGMTRVFNMLQIRELNRHLVCMVLDAIIKSVFTGHHRK